MLKGDHQNALSDFTRAIALEPRDASTYHERGLAYLAIQEFDKAVADLSVAISLQPTDPSLYSGRGDAFYGKSDYNNAILDYSRAISLSPTYELYYYRGNAYYKKGEYDRAVADYNRAIELNPKYASAYYSRGNAYAKRGLIDQAIAEYSRAISLEPDNADYYHNRALAYQMKGQQSLAEADQERAAALASNGDRQRSPAEAHSSPRYAAPKTESSTSFGTGFFVSQAGETITNAHVVEGCKQITVDGKAARLLAKDGQNDIALLATDIHPAVWAKWRLSVLQGEDIVLYGFPLAGVLASGGNISTGIVTALAGLRDDSLFCKFQRQFSREIVAAPCLTAMEMWSALLLQNLTL
jgi:tetratricopeptide (TPR) repeat protein